MVWWLNVPRHLVVKFVDGFFLDGDSLIELNAKICCIFSNALYTCNNALLHVTIHNALHTYAARCATQTF